MIQTNNQTQMATYRLISTKGTVEFVGTEAEAIAAAIEMQDELQAAFGISVENEDGKTIAEIN